MNENKNSVPEQSEPEQVTEAQEQQTAAEQESQSSEQVENAPEQIDYKAELEKANVKIAELEKKYIMQHLFIESEDYDEILPIAKKLVDDETSLDKAFNLLSVKYPEKIRIRPYIDMGGSTPGIPLSGDEFTSAFKGNIPSFSQSTANANIVKDRSGFFERGNTIKIGEIKHE